MSDGYKDLYKEMNIKRDEANARREARDEAKKIEQEALILAQCQTKIKKKTKIVKP